MSLASFIYVGTFRTNDDIANVFPYITLNIFKSILLIFSLIFVAIKRIADGTLLVLKYLFNTEIAHTVY